MIVTRPWWSGHLRGQLCGKSHWLTQNWVRYDSKVFRSKFFVSVTWPAFLQTAVTYIACEFSSLKCWNAGKLTMWTVEPRAGAIHAKRWSETVGEMWSHLHCNWIISSHRFGDGRRLLRVAFLSHSLYIRCRMTGAYGCSACRPWRIPCFGKARIIPVLVFAVCVWLLFEAGARVGEDNTT